VKKTVPALTLCAALALSACSGGSTPASKASAPAASSTTTSAPTPGTLVEGSSFGPRVRAAVLAARTAHIAMTVTGMKAEGDVATEAGAVREHLTMTLAGTPMEMILRDDAIYMRSPAFSVGDKWIAARSGGTDLMSRQLQPVFTQIKGLDPAKQVSSYVVGSQKVVGQESLDGVATTHYTAHPTEAEMRRTLAPAMAGQMASVRLTDISVDTWVDARDLPHKIVTSMKVNGKDVTTTVLMSRFGEPVSIEAPPSSQTTTAPQQ